MLNKDYKEMLECLLGENVRFLLVGAYAVHGFPRATKDIDFFVWATPDNAANLIEGMEVPVISLEDLIANKRASARLQDLADVEKLESVSVKKSNVP
jgi:hypothetical protein